MEESLRGRNTKDKFELDIGSILFTCHLLFYPRMAHQINTNSDMQAEPMINQGLTGEDGLWFLLLVMFCITEE